MTGAPPAVLRRFTHREILERISWNQNAGKEITAVCRRGGEPGETPRGNPSAVLHKKNTRQPPEPIRTAAKTAQEGAQATLKSIADNLPGKGIKARTRRIRGHSERPRLLQNRRTPETFGQAQPVHDAQEIL